jgi:hypothetical protein
VKGEASGNYNAQIPAGRYIELGFQATGARL